MPEELDITIAPDGTVTLHVKGVKGKACGDTVELFKKLVGPAKERRWTSEYYEAGGHISNEVRGS